MLHVCVNDEVRFTTENATRHGVTSEVIAKVIVLSFLTAKCVETDKSSEPGKEWNVPYWMIAA